MLLSSPNCFTAGEAPPTTLGVWAGANATLAPYEVVAGDAAHTVIGYTNFHAYVSVSGVEGYTISAVNFTATAAGVALALPALPLYRGQPAAPVPNVFLAGWGANNVTTVAFLPAPVAAGVLRVGNATLTAAGQARRTIGRCSGTRIGGNLYVDRIARLAAQYVHTCGQFGDLGAPLLAWESGALAVVGVLQGQDQFPCALNKATFVSIPFRQEWVDDTLRVVGGQAVPYEVCPSPSTTPSFTARPTTSPSVTITSSPSPTPAPIPPPYTIPWWWIMCIVLGIGVMCGGTAAAVWYSRKRLAAWRRVLPIDKAALSRPHKEHVIPPTDIDAELAAAASKIVEDPATKRIFMASMSKAGRAADAAVVVSDAMLPVRRAAGAGASDDSARAGGDPLALPSERSEAHAHEKAVAAVASDLEGCAALWLVTRWSGIRRRHSRTTNSHDRALPPPSPPLQRRRSRHVTTASPATARVRRATARLPSLRRVLPTAVPARRGSGGGCGQACGVHAGARQPADRHASHGGARRRPVFTSSCRRGCLHCGRWRRGWRASRHGSACGAVHVAAPLP